MERPSRLVPLPDVQHDVRRHIEEQWVVVDGFRTNHRQADVAADLRGFVIEVVQHLDVIAHETNRHEHHGGHAASARFANVVADIRTQPWILGTAATALEHHRPVAHGGRIGNESRRFDDLPVVACRAAHRKRHAVRGEDHLRARTKVGRQPIDCAAHVAGIGVDELLVRVPVAGVDHRDVMQSGTDDVGACVHDVLPVLRAA